MNKRYVLWETKYGPYTGGYGKIKFLFESEQYAKRYWSANLKPYQENGDTDYEIVEYYQPEDEKKFIYYLADILHSNLCHQNHTDYCAYYYEKWDNFIDGKEQYSAKQTYYTRAVNLINLLPGMTLEGYLEIIQTITGSAK